MAKEKEKSTEKIFEEFMEITHKFKEMIEKQGKDEKFKISTKTGEITKFYFDLDHSKSNRNKSLYIKVEMDFPTQTNKRRFQMRISDCHVSVLDFEDKPESKTFALSQLSILTKGEKPKFGRTGKRTILALLKFVTKVEKGFLKNKKQQEAS